MAFKDQIAVEQVPFLEGSRGSSIDEIPIFEEELKRPIPSSRLQLPTMSAARSVVFQYLIRFAIWLIPSFLRKSPKSDKPLHETAYLDGLRGYACYSVFMGHYLGGFTHAHEHPYLSSNKDHVIFQLPILRLFAHGQAGVAIFFVMSGYVLSYKSHKLIHSHQWDSLHACLSSSTFRRWLRLFLPVIGLFLANFVLVEMGAFQWTTKFVAEHKPEKFSYPVYPDYPIAKVESYLDQGKNFWDTVSIFWKDFMAFNVAVLWRWNGAGKMPDVDGHMWTLHMEFRSSCVLFLCIAGTSRMIPRLRMAWFVIASAFCLYMNEWAISTFLMGSIIANLDFHHRLRLKTQDPSSLPITDTNQNLSPPSSPLHKWWRENWDQVVYGFTFFLGLLLVGWPRGGVDPDGFFYINVRNWFMPKGVVELFYFCSLGAPLVVFSAGRLRPITRGLSTPFSQYIGKTSFALYLVHGTINKSQSFYVVVNTLKWTGYEGWGFVAGVMLPLIFVVGPTVIVCTDWFWRGVDVPSVRLTRWIESFCTDKSI